MRLRRWLARLYWRLFQPITLGTLELANRMDGWSPNPPRYTTGVLGKYAKLVQGAETGAITNTL